MEEVLRKYLVSSLSKKRLISLLFVLVSPVVIYFSGAAIGALFLLIFISAVFGLYRFNRDYGIVSNGRMLEYKFTGFLQRGRMVKWYVPTVEDPEDKTSVQADNLTGTLPKEQKVFGFKNGKKHFFVNEEVVSRIR